MIISSVGPWWRYVLYLVPLELLLLLLLLLLLILYITIFLGIVCSFLLHSTAGDMTDRERARDGGWRPAKGCRLESKLVRYKGPRIILTLRNRTHSMIWTLCSYQCYSIRKLQNVISIILICKVLFSVCVCTCVRVCVCECVLCVCVWGQGKAQTTTRSMLGNRPVLPGSLLSSLHVQTHTHTHRKYINT